MAISKAVGGGGGGGGGGRLCMQRTCIKQGQIQESEEGIFTTPISPLMISAIIHLIDMGGAHIPGCSNLIRRGYR